MGSEYTSMKMRRSIDDVVDAIERLKRDDRFKSKPALVQVNAPLALVQTEIRATINALEWVIGVRTTWWGEST